MSLVSLKTGPDDDYERKMVYPYGWGTEIRLNDEQCQALGITAAIPAGTQLMLNAAAFVRESSSQMPDDADDQGVQYTLCLQITDLELTQPNNRDKAASKLYAAGTGDA